MGRRGVHELSYIFRLLFIKPEKIQEWLIQKSQIRQHFYVTIFFLGRIIKKLRKEGQAGPTLFFEEVSIVVLIVIIAILLALGICSAV